MNRVEFLESLRRALAGQISAQNLQQNMDYYRDYLSSEISRGRSEEEVLAELGDPRLIAKTIIDADEASEESRGYHQNYQETADARYSYRDRAEEAFQRDGRFGQTAGQSAGQGTYEDPRTAPGGRRSFSFFGSSGQPVTLTGFKATLIIAGVIILILAVLSLIFTAIFAVLKSPVFWIILLGYLGYRFIQDKKNGGGGGI